MIVVRKLHKLLLVAWISGYWLSCFSVETNTFKPFCQSFIDGLSFNPESRFVHEYHPYLLAKTQDSLHQLESYITQQGFVSAHRLVILGYEQYAVPQYFDCLSQQHIDDEAAIKTKGSWEFTPGNVCGFLTGYLFKDANMTSQHVVEHIVPECVELFGENTEVLKKHAFGDWNDTLAGYQEVVQKNLQDGDVASAMARVVDFWQYIYESREQCGQQYRATQDLLFSFYYVKYLLNSAIPFKKIFVGPDVTYPIEVTERQPAEVTRNAQTFVQRFIQELKPVNGQKTAYIFCSFVDGVGKSTLLGNICNWQKYGTDFSAYTHVSNASSQSATLYHFNDQVCIVDLPAQISHYCAKPDGCVYIDLGFSTLTSSEKKAVQTYVSKNFEAIRSAQPPASNTIGATPEEQVWHNIMLIGSSSWRPCAFDGKHYAISLRDPRHIRVLVPFDQVHSQGLKIKEPELMIFDRGLAIPMNYQVFLADLTKQMKNAGVEQVVFVDFASLYPRTSRETVRINYMVQLLKQFYGDEFDLMSSMYRPFGHAHEVYPLFFQQRDAFERGVFLEALLRYVIHDVIMQASRDGIAFMTSYEVQQQLRARIKQLYGNCQATVDDVLRAVRRRVDQELPQVAIYQYSKFYEAVSRFSVKRMAQLSDLVQQFVARYHPDDSVRIAWNRYAADIESFSSDHKKAILTNGVQLEMVRPLQAHELDQPLLEVFAHTLRKSWYDQIVGVVVSELAQAYAQAWLIKKDAQGDWYLLHQVLFKTDERPLTLLDEVSTFDMGNHTWYDDDGAYMPTCIDRIRKEFFSKQIGNAVYDLFIPTSAVCAELDNQNAWAAAGNRTRKMILPKIEHVSRETLQLLVRMLATMHTILKNPRDEIMVRCGNQEDFIACVRLLEDLIVPKYFDLPLKERLFDDYTTIVPLIGESVSKA